MRMKQQVRLPVAKSANLDHCGRSGVHLQPHACGLIFRPINVYMIDAGHRLNTGLSCKHCQCSQTWSLGIMAARDSASAYSCASAKALICWENGVGRSWQMPDSPTAVMKMLPSDPREGAMPPMSRIAIT